MSLEWKDPDKLFGPRERRLNDIEMEGFNDAMEQKDYKITMDCPYPAGSEEAQAWQKGFDSLKKKST